MTGVHAQDRGAVYVASGRFVVARVSRFKLLSAAVLDFHRGAGNDVLCVVDLVLTALLEGVGFIRILVIRLEHGCRTAVHFLKHCDLLLHDLLVNFVQIGLLLGGLESDHLHILRELVRDFFEHLVS